MEAVKENAVISKPREWVAQAKDGWQNVVAEMKKVTWPGTNEVVGTTIVVLATTVIFAVFLWLCDYGFGNAVLWLLRRFGASV